MAPMKATQARQANDATNAMKAPTKAMKGPMKTMKKPSAPSNNTAAMEDMYMKCTKCGWSQPVFNADVGSALVFYEYYCLECGGQVFEITERRHSHRANNNVKK